MYSYMSHSIANVTPNLQMFVVMFLYKQVSLNFMIQKQCFFRYSDSKLEEIFPIKDKDLSEIAN